RGGRDVLPRWLARSGTRLARPDLGHREDLRFPVPLHVDPRHAPAGPLRPADVARLEGAAAPGHPQRPRDGRAGDRHVNDSAESLGFAYVFGGLGRVTW